MKELTKYGKFIYNLCDKTGFWFAKHKIIYWILMCTWALPTTLLGTLCYLVLRIFKKPKDYFGTPMFVIGKNWGGLELGICFAVSEPTYSSICNHEVGHTYQIILGPFILFLVSIPSAIRYWYRELVYYKRHKNPKTLYDDIWFERSATDLGNKIIEYKRSL